MPGQDLHKGSEVDGFILLTKVGSKQFLKEQRQRRETATKTTKPTTAMTTTATTRTI